MTNEKDTFFSEENEAKSSWFKFNDVGDKIAGILIEVADKEPHGKFKAQKLYTLKTAEGEEWIVPISVTKKRVVSAMNRASIGQKVGFLFKDLYITDQMKSEGSEASKTIVAFLDPNFVKPTVPEGMEGLEEAPTEDITLDQVPF